jgi:hypothetical protein
MKPKEAPVAKPAPIPPPAPESAEESLAKKLICAHCKTKIDYKVGIFCWNNSKRFGGLQYCREHQGLFA